MPTLSLLARSVRHQVPQPERKYRPSEDAYSVSSSVLDRERLFAEFAPLVRRLIRQYGQDAEMRQDLSGEIYCRFCDLLEAYDPERGVPLRPYLVRQLSAGIYTYARQQWQLKRRETTWETREGRSEPLADADPTPSWVFALSQQMVVEALPEAMSKLPARQRKVVIWRYYEERSFEEIAQRLNIQVATARSLLRHGLNKLRKQIQQEEWAI
ncbi:MAG TPA: sigma-70 family RNA polymerase sigma factor [Chthonomonadaceae bacterium]|nr:sigma-70 family RNA polymerase sigma factor [Chthonomonadaceae bacterium]